MCRLTLAMLVAFSTTATAQSAKKSTPSPHRPMTITYGSPSWNTDSRKIDTAYMVIRDKASGKMVHILLEETEPDSSQFKGSFSLSLGEAEKVQPEVYIPPQDIRGADKDFRKLYEGVKDGSLPRKPLITKTNDRGSVTLDVYDNREQAESALKVYQEQQKIEREMKKKALIKPPTSEQNLAAAKQAERKAMLDKLALEATNREAERIRLAQIEKQKAEERDRQAKALTEAERALRRAKAAKLAEQALALYTAGNFVEAENKFHQAVDLDPENKSYFFKYGVALYRNNKFNDAIVTLKLAQVDAKTDVERKYYVALCHYRLGELDLAAKTFHEIVKSNDPTIAPSALFYLGIVQFAQEKFEDSKKSFETVIDISTDPRMDEQAEEYLDRIATALMYKKMRENKFNLMAVIGMQYDSNVLLSPDSSSDQGSSTNISDTRLMTVAELGYRPVFSEHHEWSTAANASLTNSSKTAAAKADPFLYNFSAPYAYKGMLFKKGYKLGVKPAYEMLYMDPSGTGTKTIILTSNVLSIDNTFVMTKEWFSTYTFEWRTDSSKTADSVGPDDSSATKYSLKTTQMVFLDKGKKEALMANLGYVLNSANGYNKKFTRIEGGATYLRPISWGAAWNFGVTVYQLKYPDADTKRTDLNVTLTTGISKPIREWVTWGVTGSYTKNSSDVTANTYSKYLVMTTATFTTSF